MKQSQFILDRVPGVTVAQITAILKANIQFETEIFKKQPLCAYCNKTLTSEEISKISPDDYNYTCSEHYELRNYFQINRVIKDHNIKQLPLPYEFDCI